MNVRALEKHPLSKTLLGKILLREELPLDEKYLQTLIKQGKIRTEKSIQFKNQKALCLRCGNQKPYKFAQIPCAKCGEKHLYCRSCIQMNRVLACEPVYIIDDDESVWEQIEHACHWEGRLTVAQQKAADRIKQTIDNQERELLIWAVAGSGKTEVLFPGIERALQKGSRICIATPRADVVRELQPRIQAAFPTNNVDALYGTSEVKETDAQIVIATTHQLMRYNAAFQLIVVDEIDAFPYTHDETLPFVTKRALKQTGSMIFLTATPRREMQRRVKNNTLPHVFIPKRYHNHPLPVPRLVSNFAFKKQINENKIPQVLNRFLTERKIKSRQILLFVPTIKAGKKLLPLLQSKLPVKDQMFKKDTIAFVHAEDHDREEKVQQFRSGKLNLLITTTILERGVTFPSVDVLVLDAGHVVFDDAALVQIAGRAGRSKEDPFGIVWFIHRGKTRAMIDAVQSIKTMNKRGGF